MINKTKQFQEDNGTSEPDETVSSPAAGQPDAHGENTVIYDGEDEYILERESDGRYRIVGRRPRTPKQEE